MSKNSYEKTIQILKELEADDQKYGLFSCFGSLPTGEVVYFDEVGTPCRVNVKGTALIQGSPLELKNQPVQVVSTGEAFKLLAAYEQGQYLKNLSHQRAKRIEWQYSRRRRSLRLIAAAGAAIALITGLMFALNSGSPEQKLRAAEQRLREFYADQGVLINGYQDVTVVNTGGYNPLGPVSISRSTFKQFLTELNSPALPEADRMYQACIEEGCDPAVALAFFEHESGGGKMGVASQTRSIGNIRCSTGYSCVGTDTNGSFRQYASWSDGVRDWSQLLKMYKNDMQRVTLEDIIPKYAPQSDNNNETAYITLVKKRVDELRSRENLVQAKRVEGNLPVGNPVWEDDWVITQGFTAKHPEIDLARPLPQATGTGIHSTLSGIVTVVRDDPLFGNRVFVTGTEFSVHFNHLTPDLPVQSGQNIQRGDVIGYMGNSGKSTGPHLDYEIFQGDQRVNPMNWILRN